MKIPKIYLFLFVLILFTFSSCDPNEIDNASVYWNSNTLTRLQLKGNVKKIDLNSGMQVDEFNQNGFITKSVYTNVDFTSTTIYNYDSSDKLLSIDFTSTGGKGVAYTTNFEYQNVNKYIVQNKYHLLMDGLVPNFKASINEFSRTDYEVTGNILKIIESYESEGVTYRDTTVVEYDGKYPTKITSGELSIDNFSYATNGMFLGYTQTTQNETWSSECIYYFKPDNEYLMLDSMVNASTQGASTRIDRDIYEYDPVYKTMTGFKNYMGEYRYTYTYDSNQNWISKLTEYRSDSSSAFSVFSTENRVITYWP